VKNSVTLTAKLVTEPIMGRLKDGTGEWARARAAFWPSGPRQGYIGLITFDPGVAEQFRSLTTGCVVELRGELDYNQWTDQEGRRRSEVQLRVFQIELEQRPPVATRVTRSRADAAAQATDAT